MHVIALGDTFSAIGQETTNGSGSTSSSSGGHGHGGGGANNSGGGVVGVSRPNCIILDEIDGIDGRASIEALLAIVKAPLPRKVHTLTLTPIILATEQKIPYQHNIPHHHGLPLY